MLKITDRKVLKDWKHWRKLKFKYYHRSLQDIFNLCFDTGFVIDGFYEECYFNKEIPDIIIVRAIKIER